MAAATTETAKRKHPLLCRAATFKTTSTTIIDPVSSQVKTIIIQMLMTLKMTYSIRCGIRDWKICLMGVSAFRRSTKLKGTTQILSKRSCRSFQKLIWRTEILKTAKSLRISIRHSNSFFKKLTVIQRKMTMSMQIWNSFHSSFWLDKNNKYNGLGSSKIKVPTKT